MRAAGAARLILAVVVSLTLPCGAALAYWSTGSVPGGSGAAAAASVEQGATPAAVAGGDASVTLTWAARTLSSGQAVTGYRVARYASGGSTSEAVHTGCSGIVAALSCTETDVPGGSWQYTVTPVFATSWTGPASDRSASVTIDRTPPANAITSSGAAGNAYLSGSTVWYRGAAPGSFTLRNAVTDAGSGPASSQTAALAGATSGWSHTPSTVSSPAGGPFESAAFGWAGGTYGSPTETVTGRDAAGNAATTSLTFVNDGGNPLFGGIDYPHGYTSGRSVTVTFDQGYDFESGIDPSLGRLKRFVAPLVDGVCGAFTTNNNFAFTSTSPYVDTTVRAGSCYAYQYVATDHVGNRGFYGTGNVAKVDYAGAVAADSGLLSRWRFGEAAITSSDAFTDFAGTPLSDHTSQDGSTWTRRPGETGTMTITSTDSLRGSSTSGSVYYTDEALTSADYLVEADVVVESTASRNDAGVVGRLDPSSGAGTYYAARFDSGQDRWELSSTVNGTTALLGTWPQEAVAGRRHRVGLDLRGSRIQLLVDGVVRITGTDTSITGTGRTGVALGEPTETGGLLDLFDHRSLALDDFEVSPPAADSRGTNSADYHRGVTLGTAGVVAGNTAATFDGKDDFVKSVTTDAFPTGAAPRSVEVWFKTPGLAAGQQRQALFSYGTDADTQEFGVWLEENGYQIKSDGGGASDRVLTWSTSFNDDQWHHFVSTYDGTSTKMYVDGVLGSGDTTATKDTVINATHGYAIGAILDQRAYLTDSSFFHGSLDEMALYGTALSQTTIVDHYQLGTSPAPDVTGPTGGSVQGAGLGGTGARFSTSTTLSLTLATGTDPSGIVLAGNQLLRASGSLSGGTCSGFGGYTQVAGDPGATFTDTVADDACYRYQYVVLDTYGNPTTYQAADIAVDTTPPGAPTLSFSGQVDAAWAGSGSTVYYRPGASSGSVTVTAAASDPVSGIAGYAFPSLGTGWTSTSDSADVTTYSWSGTPAVPGTTSVTATDNAGLVGAGGSFTLTPDDAAPSAGTISYASGVTTGSSVTVSFTTGTDSGSGVGARLLQRAAAPATDSTCGTYGAFSTITGGIDPTSPVVDTIAGHTCYRYRYVVADRVGNQSIATSTSVAHTGFGAAWSFDEGSGTTAADSSGGDSTLTLRSTGTGWSTGRVGPAALHVTSAQQGFARVLRPVLDTSQSYSVAAWVKLDSLQSFQTAVSMDGGSVSAFYLQRSNDGRFTFDQYKADSTSAAHTVVAGLSPVAGTWYHLVGTFDQAAGTISLYVNGAHQGTATGASGFTATGSTLVGRARYNGGAVDYFDGSIDDVRLYDRVLTQAEITALANPS